QSQIRQTHVHQSIELAGDRRYGAEVIQRLFHREVQYFTDIAPAITDLERFPVVALAAADIAIDVHVRQKVHLHLYDAVALAGFASSTAHVEGETSGVIAACPGFEIGRAHV